MNKYMYALIAACTFAASLGGGTPASAQQFDRYGVPLVSSWQAVWDTRAYDRRHVIVGQVVGFQPYRVQVARRNGRVQNVDLKNGTVIFPTGSTPAPGEHVALLGYYSQGTFIVNRLIIR